ncbi:UNVERIFIED_CONTAM: hypothetical protein Slati_0894800 [Sesamum latifolium]|uniref:Reverse transcriptase domain-containing protein n=1 Tax=Sesamum latifolium TaxID=2727402 RepID=A0AAW2XPB0_9LAMI
MTRAVTRDDVNEALFDIGEDKALGPDGFSSGFFKVAWPVIGDEFTAAIQDFFNSGKLLKQINLPSTFPHSEVFGFPQTLIAWVEECISSATFSVSLNGELHGFFKGARGLRQGDPMSLYLFILAMEVLNLLLLQRVNQSNDISYHRHCEEMKLMSLCFDDDLLLFCHPHVPSVQLLRDGLHTFAEWSSLEANIHKSQLIVSKSALAIKPLPLATLGFQEVDERLRGWSTLQLSYAARIQLLRSVVSSLNVYWAMAFILPKGVLREIEARMRKFLWQGGTGTDRDWRYDLTLAGTVASPGHHRFPNGPQTLGIPLEATLNVVIVNGDWNWPEILDIHHREIMDELPPLSETDCILWNSTSGRFTNQDSFQLFQPIAPKVAWYTLLMGSFRIPRNNVILWLAILGRLVAILGRLSTLDQAFFFDKERNDVFAGKSGGCVPPKFDTHMKPRGPDRPYAPHVDHAT